MLFFKQIMDAQSVDETVSLEIGPVENQNINELTYYIVFSAGTASGAVQPETAHVSGYTGTWSPEGSAISSSDGAVKHVSVTGITKIRRCRISTAIGSGTVSVYVIGR